MLIKVMVLKDMPTIHIGQLMFNFGGANGGHPANFIPFMTIAPYLLGEQGLVIVGVNLLGNIALLVPLGLLAPLIFRSITARQASMLALVTGLIIEMLQVILQLGIFDVDDIILNALGVMTGYGIYTIFSKWLAAHNYKNMAITIGAIIIVGAGSLYALYPKNHPVINPAERATLQVSNPCGRTKGTGEITEITSKTITIKRNDNTFQRINLTDRTGFKTAAGDAQKTDLKLNDRVTVVIDDTETASVVLVCGP